MQVKIEDDLYKSISEYCSINGLKICHYVNEILKKQLMLDKYGSKPFLQINKSEEPKVKTIVVETKKVENTLKEEKTEEITKEVIKNNDNIIDVIQPNEEDDEEIEIEQPKSKKRKLK